MGDITEQAKGLLRLLRTQNTDAHEAVPRSIRIELLQAVCNQHLDLFEGHDLAVTANIDHLSTDLLKMTKATRVLTVNIKDAAALVFTYGELLPQLIQGSQLLQAQSIHAAMVASYCRSFYNIAPDDGFAPHRQAKTLTTIIDTQSVAISKESNLRLASLQPDHVLYIGGPGDYNKLAKGTLVPSETTLLASLDLSLRMPGSVPTRDLTAYYNPGREEDVLFPLSERAHQMRLHECILYHPSAYLDVEKRVAGRVRVRKTYFD
ncbi:hypothetical protein CC86DRAFT_413398 [Ophiobolus disseminans]|uniref:Uncharacterized protein n=1 Tax=Ophiobolus disseminans TaxID=1469910 RepID=A0A6A6ZD34_9PLEO|nr:hypothetical protein CC86DRAFT_413398 [Ophiobolus disseminans]